MLRKVQLSQLLRRLRLVLLLRNVFTPVVAGFLRPLLCISSYLISSLLHLHITGMPKLIRITLYREEP